MNRVVTQFLDYSKPPNLDFRQIDMSKLAEKTIDTLRPSLVFTILKHLVHTAVECASIFISKDFSAIFEIL